MALKHHWGKNTLTSRLLLKINPLALLCLAHLQAVLVTTQQIGAIEAQLATSPPFWLLAPLVRPQAAPRYLHRALQCLLPES